MNELFNFGQPRNLVTTYAPTIGMPSTIEQDVLPVLLVKYEKETGLFPEKFSVLILNNRGIIHLSVDQRMCCPICIHSSWLYARWIKNLPRCLSIYLKNMLNGCFDAPNTIKRLITLSNAPFLYAEGAPAVWMYKSRGHAENSRKQMHPGSSISEKATHAQTI